ncbi:MAG: hypothetical protein GC160_08305 [Acidobacteria bacterium]|nr:hypothetical protein [Acidobacteriota bacterium]
MGVVKELVSLEDYLSMSFDGVDAELIDGEVAERPMPNDAHSLAQQVLAEAFGPARKAGKILARPELRVQVDPRTVFVPDYCVFAGATRDPRSTNPPWLVAEIISPSDVYSRLVYKLDHYRAWGVEHVWVIDPEQRRLSVYRQEGLLRVSKLELPDLGVSLEPADLFDEPAA